MSSNIYNHNSSVRDIAKLFAEEKRLGTKAADLVNGTALTKCLEINEAFEVLGTPWCLMSWVQQVHNAAVVARSLGCQCDTEMPTGRTLTET